MNTRTLVIISVSAAASIPLFCCLSCGLLNLVLPPSEPKQMKVREPVAKAEEPVQPLTDEEKVRQAIPKLTRQQITKLEINGYQGGPRKYVIVRFDVKDGALASTQKHGKLDTLQILEGIKVSGIDAAEVVVIGRASLTDKFGNSSKSEVFKASYTDSTINKTNFQNFDFNRILEIADTKTVHPTFAH
jgi:hypothetical protein